MRERRKGNAVLILNRAVGETLIIDDEVEIRVLEINGCHCSLGIIAPQTIAIHREEVYQRIQQQKEDLPDHNEDTVYEGEITSLVEQRGFGFISMAGLKNDVFFHADEVDSETGYEGLRQGDTVAFTLRMTDKGYRARNVKLKQCV